MSSPYNSIYAPRRPKRPPVTVSKKRRAEIIERDGPICFYCLKVLAPAEITMDHVKPRSQGGTAEPENLRVACKSCNSSKRTRAWPYEHICARRPE